MKGYLAELDKYKQEEVLELACAGEASLYLYVRKAELCFIEFEKEYHSEMLNHTDVYKKLGWCVIDPTPIRDSFLSHDNHIVVKVLSSDEVKVDDHDYWLVEDEVNKYELVRYELHKSHKEIINDNTLSEKDFIAFLKLNSLGRCRLYDVLVEFYDKEIFSQTNKIHQSEVSSLNGKPLSSLKSEKREKYPRLVDLLVNDNQGNYYLDLSKIKI
ncbi:hypothetical protein [Halobacteriovorax sp.]|uniref:hypothetical protein n=1 Tax=Halobacteriovorax sp. TaxID=2020862 RepID=UPI003AF2AB72